MEDARREVLGMSPEGGGTAAEYLDAKARALLAEEGNRLDAAPTRFARVIMEAGRTQAEVATAIGVSPSLVGHWATGRRRPSEDQILEVAAYLTVKPWNTDLTSHPLSYFGWLKTHVVAPNGDPTDVSIAAYLGVSTAKLTEWTYGISDPTPQYATRFVKRYLPRQLGALGT
jgi:DNA-binding transcriptional regulator YiaG